jgi:type III pantothenate kinase
MHQALGTATAQLPDLSATAFEPIKHDIFAKSTAEAIHSGVLHAISGAITLMSHSLNGLYKTRPKVILSGGNANIIKENLIADVTRQTHIVDNLVLHGLHLLSTNA